MPLFLSDEEYERFSNDGAAAVAEKADEFIRELLNQLDTVRAQSDAAAITAEQTCSLLEHKFVSLSSEFAKVQSQNSSLESLSSDLALARSDKHQITIQLIAKEGEIERLCAEASELKKSKTQFTDLLEQKDSEISEKNALIKTYLDKILNLTDAVSLRESRLNEVEADLARSNASCSRLSQEKELLERHNLWLSDELTNKVNSLMELRKAYGEVEADLSSKIADLERKLSESCNSLKWNKDNATDLEKKLKSVQEDLSICQETAAANEERHHTEMTTVNKLVELYKESSQEWSKKAGALDGVIKALETRLNQVENDYKEKLEKELSARTEIEKEAALLREKLNKFEAEIETSRRASEINLLPFGTSSIEPWVDSVDEHDLARASQMVVPNVPSGVSGTALAASLLRDGWSLVKMYTKYQEAVDALRHEQLGRKQSQEILERVLFEIEEKAGVIMDERAEHGRFVEAYSVMNQKLQYSLSEQNNLERSIKELKADLRRCERDNSIAQKEVTDLQKQVTILLKECQEVQLRCGSVADGFADDSLSSIMELNAEADTGKVISQRLLAYKDIHGLVEQNVQLRSLVRSLSDQIESTEMELKEKFKMELQKQDNEAAVKVNAVLARAEEQGQMIESLHTSVAMYKRLYEEEQRHHSSYPLTSGTNQDDGRKNLMLLLEGPQEAMEKVQEEATERVRCLENELEKLRSEMRSLRSERDKLAKEAEFAQEKLDRNLKELEHQRGETNAVISRNVEFSQLIIDYQRKLRESSETVQAAQECSCKLNMEVSVLKCEKEMLSNAEKRACDEVRSLSERVYRLQASLDTLHSADEAREEANRMERRKQDDYVNQIQKEWAHAKKELDEERVKVQHLTLDLEEIRKSSFKQVEDMRKDLSTLSNAVAAAEARAAAAEAQAADMEKIRSHGTLFAGRDGELEVSSSRINEVLADLRVAREEIKNLREEVEINKAHMLQYKSIAQVNEEALKQLELAHATFKVEADKVRMSLEAEVLSMKERFNELECEYSSKFKEAASSGAAREADLISALSEIEQLKQESSMKMSQIATLEIQVTSLKDDLDKEHKNRRDAQTNYERQVILQSETIQELTKTSEALALLQEEISELRKLSEALKIENSQLKSTWDCERALLEESKIVAEKKYNELNEQNKILHIRLEALHIKLAEKDRDFAGISSSGTDLTQSDVGLQNVVNYLRRSKEIAETEISLLKQEKLRMQSQLESALRATESAQASLQAVRANSRAMVFTEDEFKSLQIQVREVHLLRESNVQLREENKHNFEECQKLREVAQKARMEIEQRDSLFREKQIELEASKKEYQMQKLEKDHLEKKVEELLERCRNYITIEDYHRMRDDIKQMQSNLSEKDVQLENAKKLLYDKDGEISELQKDLAKSRKELSEREGRINASSQVEDSLRKDIAHFKKIVETLSLEKDELRKQNEALSKQFEELKQGRKGVSDEVMKEKEENDAKIKILLKMVEKQKKELSRERDDLKTEKAKRQKTESIIVEKIKSVDQEKSKLVDGLEKHKQARERLTNEVEKLKHAEKSLPEGTSVVQILCGSHLEDLSAAYLLAVENFERVAHSLASELVVPPAPYVAPVVDASSAVVTSGQTLPLQDLTTLAAASTNTSLPSAKPAEKREGKFMSPTTNVEPRKRILVRRPKKNDGPQVDTEMLDAEKSNNTEKPVFSHNVEPKEVPPQLTHTTFRKRPALSTPSETKDESLVQRGASSDTEAPALKKAKGSDSIQETTEDNTITIPENLETVQEASDFIGDRPQKTPHDESLETEKDDGETGEEQDEDRILDTANQSEAQSESNIVLEEFETNKNESDVVFDDGLKAQAEEEMQQSTMESEGEREEGELPSDAGDVGEEMVEDRSEPDVPPVSSPLVDEDDLIEANEDETGDNSNEGNNNQGEIDAEAEADQVPEAICEAKIDGNKNLEAVLDLGERSAAADVSDVKSILPETTGEAKKDENQNPETVSDLGERSSAADVSDVKSILSETTGGAKKDGNQNPEAVSDLGERSTAAADVSDVKTGGTKEGSSSSVTQETQEVRQASPIGRGSTTINLQERAKLRSAMRQQNIQQGRGSTPPPPSSRGRGRLGRGRGARGQGSGGGRG